MEISICTFYHCEVYSFKIDGIVWKSGILRVYTSDGLYSFKIDGIVWKYLCEGAHPPTPQSFKIDGIVWKSMTISVEMRRSKGFKIDGIVWKFGIWFLVT